MTDPTANLAAMIGSRICHDLISPIGAISNGLELMALSGEVPTEADLSPEFSLITESCADANARIRFFRVAFGSAGAAQKMGSREITGILTDIGRGSRIATQWRPTGDLPRSEVQLAFLFMLCFETAMAHGGDLLVEADEDGLTLTGTSARLNTENGLWPLFQDQPLTVDVTPARVEFALAHKLARDAGRPITLTHEAGSLVLKV